MRLRVRSTKLGKVRFVSHRDAARLWERALRKVRLPVATTAGFTPRPKLSFGLALPTGAESLAEYLDVELRPDVSGDDVDVSSLAHELSAAMPDGIDVTVVADCTERTGSLQESVTSCTWELWGPRLTPARIDAARGLLDADHLLVERERKGERRTDDIRPLLVDLRSDGTGTRLVADLATSGRALRPSELAALAFADVDPLDVRALRTHQWTSHDGERREVLSLPAVVAATGLGAGA
jgi:radical SAM-linked protein